MSDKQHPVLAEAQARHAPPPDALKRVERWLIDQALAAPTTSSLVSGLCELLNEIGCPVSRCHLTYSMLHPLFEAEGVTWLRGSGIQHEGYDHRVAGRSDAWRRSPIRHVIVENLTRFRVPLQSSEGRAAAERWPVLGDLAAAGYTDYLASGVRFDSFTSYNADRDPATSVSGMVLSWTTAHLGGFTEADTELLVAMLPILAVAVKMAVQDHIAHSVVETYLGRDAGRQVLDGSIHLGDGAMRSSVILFVDMRESSRLSEALDQRRFLTLVNRFLAAFADGIVAEGGEIVSFLGDGMLSIFPFDSFDEERARFAALRAIQRGFAALEGIDSGVGYGRLGCSVGLHVGDVLYGNIGVQHRMTWSVLGRVVNEAARLQELAKSEAEPVLASDAFVMGCGDDGPVLWRSLGVRELRGLSAPVEVFALTTPPIATV